MKPQHREILNRLEEYLNQPGAESLRFWQALYNVNIIKGDLKTSRLINTPNIIEDILIIRDDYNISDAALLKRIK